MSAAVDLPTVLKRRTRVLESHLPAALEGDPRALHRARVASRRLREVLPLAAAGQKVGKRVRRLTVLLGRVREMDVALDLLATGELGGVSRLASAEARQQLQIEREKRRDKMLRRFRKLNPDKLIRALGDLSEAASGHDAERWRRTLAGRIARRATGLRRAVDAAGAIYVTERLHAVRIAAKKLRYALEIAAELGVPDAAGVAATVRRTQVTLGNLQDRTVLLRHVHAAANGADGTMREGLAALESEIEASSRDLHAQFLSQRGALATALVAVRQHVVPALAGPKRRRPSLKARTAAMTHGRTDRAVPHSTRPRGATRRRLA
jgi:CHAD domain-containing protein